MGRDSDERRLAVTTAIFDVEFEPDAPSGMPDDPRPVRDVAAKLREFYQSVQEEAIPERFVTLLEQLAEAERKADNANESK